MFVIALADIDLVIPVCCMPLSTQAAPRLCGSSHDFDFVRECMKICLIHPKFQFSAKIEIKMTPLLVLFCYSLHLLFLSHLEAVLSTFKILSCTNNGC